MICVNGALETTLTSAARASIQVCSSRHAPNQLGKQECVVCHKPLGHHGVEAFSMFGNPITNTVPITK